MNNSPLSREMPGIELAACSSAAGGPERLGCTICRMAGGLIGDYIPLMSSLVLISSPLCPTFNRIQFRPLVTFKSLAAFFAIFLLIAGSVLSESVTATDGGTAIYGACNGVAIDFDATAAPNAPWTPSLISGRAYTLKSVAIKNASGNTGTNYLGVYTGFSGGNLSGFLGVSDTAKNFTNSPNNWLTFTFSNLNCNLTVDSTVGSGSGMLYFVYQPGTSGLTQPNGATLATDKFNADTYMTNSLAGIIAYGRIVANRSPQYQATITPVSQATPPAAPTSLSATGGNAAVVLAWTESSDASSYNVWRSLTSGSGYTTVANVTGTNVVDIGLTNGTTYYYVVSALNYYGESTNSAEASAAPVFPPAAPTGLTALSSNIVVSLAWAASGGATSYNVKRSITGRSGYATVASVAGTNAVDTGLNYLTTYYYVVSALTGASESANSTEVSARTAGLPDSVIVANSTGVSVMVGSNGFYLVNFSSPAWTFSGSLAQTLTGLASNTGADNVGAYSQITFNYNSAVPHTAGIRLYENSPVVTFNDKTLAAGANDLAFPHWTNYPPTTSHLSFGNIFSPYNFATLFDDNLWLCFQTNHDAFIISAATNYMVSSMLKKSDGSISCGINSDISQLPSGFAHRVILAVTNGINQIYPLWGNTLMAMAGKTPPANDACVELNKIGYWTDNGAAYHYSLPSPASNIGPTLISVINEYASKGIQLGYMQLDSWWYEKGSCQCWLDNWGADGTSLWIPDPALFANGLAAFRQQLGLPLFLHNRWIDVTNSPYVTASNFQMSASVCIDPVFWTNIMAYTKSVGGCTYEQDWLGFRGTPTMNLNDGPAYLNNMAAAAAANGINLQYCMNQGRDYLQASLYTNVMTTRDCPDVFNTNNWKNFLYGAPMTHALGVWAWSDVYSSSATRNLLISTLSAGPVGAGDPLDSANARNLLKSVRPDGVIVKPDVPLAPVDDAYVNDAQSFGQPFVAAAYTDFTSSRALYVFAFGENASKLATGFTPAAFGITGNAYVYNYFAATGTVVNAGSAFNFTTSMPDDTNGGSYFIAVPIGPSGIAFLGDTNKFVMLGKKRISSFSDTGLLRATVAFAAGETNVTLCGYASSSPYALALEGATNNLTYNSTTHLFTLNVSPDNSGTATVALSLARVPSPQIMPGSGGRFQISWPAAAVGYVLEKATNLTPPTVWSPVTDPITPTNGQNMVDITNPGPTSFYRLRQ